MASNSRGLLGSDRGGFIIRFDVIPQFGPPAVAQRYPFDGMNSKGFMNTPMINVVRSSKGQRRTSFGVSFDLLAVGPASMTTLMHYRIGNVIPFHAHPNEQAGYILSGRVRVLTRDSESELGPGDSYTIPAGIEHSIEIVEDAEELQVFSPPRPEFL